MGISTAEVMKLSEQGAIDSTTAINAVVKGMQTNFVGGMEAMSKTVPGLLSTIKDNAGMVLKEIGDKITTALDLTGILTKVSDFLTQFSAAVKSSGISDAIKGLIPPQAIAAVFALSGALVGAGVAAMVLFGGAVLTAMAPLLPFIALGAAVGLLAYEIWVNWEPLSGLFSALWDAVYSVTTSYWDLISSILFSVWDSIYSNVTTSFDSIVNVVFGSWDNAKAFTAEIWNEIVMIISGAVDLMFSIVKPLLGLFGVSVTKAETFFNAVTSGIKNVSEAAKNVDISKLSAGIEMKDLSGSIPDAAKPNRVFSGLHGGGQAAAPGGGGGGSSAEKELEKLEKKAEQVSNEIEKEWVQLTKTQLEQLDIWKSEEISKLDESKDANENYERDKERIAAVYSVRRTKIIQTEAKDAIDAFKTIRDGYMSIQKELTLGGLPGSKKDKASKGFDLADKEKGVVDYFDKINQEYETGNERQRQNILSSLDRIGIAYQKSESDRLDFSVATDAAIMAYRKNATDESLNYYATAKDVQADIDAAYAANSMTMLQEALTAENAMRMNDYTAQKSMMDTYQAAFLAAHSTTAQLMSDLYSSAFGGLSTNISEILQGTKSIGDAFTALGQTMLKVVADYVAKWLAGKLMMAIFGKTTMATETALSVAAGAATAAAWAPAAAMVSLATFGANAAPAMAGIAATTGMSMALSVPALAGGGITTGPTLAMIGEGRYDEAVLPLDKNRLEKMGLGGNSDQPQQIIHNHNYTALDGKSFGRWLEDGGGAVIEKYTRGRARSFAGV